MLSTLHPFKLSKLLIAAYTDAVPASRSGAMEVQFNPETLALKFENTLRPQSTLGKTSEAAVYVGTAAKVLTLNIVLDGTGAQSLESELEPGAASVSARIQELLRLCHAPAPREPARLRLFWHQSTFGMFGFACRLQSLDVKYTSFDRDGSPLHAELTATFLEDGDAERTALAPVDPETMPQLHLIKSGDSLPQLCRERYGSAAHVLAVAAENGLDSIRDLPAGRALRFPALGKGR